MTTLRYRLWKKACTLETVKSNGFWWTSCPAMRFTTPMVSPASLSSTVPTTSPCWMGGRGVIGQVEIFLRHRAIPRGGQQGHHAVGGVELQGVGIGGVFDRDLRQRLVGVQRGLDGKALEHPVDELGGLAQRRAAVGIAVIIAGVGALHDAEDVGGPVLVGPRDIALIAAVVFVGHHIAHAALHGAAVEPAAAGLVQGHVLAQQHKALGMLFLG